MQLKVIPSAQKGDFSVYLQGEDMYETFEQFFGSYPTEEKARDFAIYLIAELSNEDEWKS